MAKLNERMLTCNNIPKKSYCFFQELKKRKDLCDVTFQVGNESIFAHRIIIAAVIPYFRSLLPSNDTEREKDGIIMPNIDPSAFKCLIEFSYSCEMKIDAENVRNLLAAACFLGVDEVREECYDFLGTILDEENVMDIHELAQNLNCRELLEITECYFIEHFVEISQTKNFLNWPLSCVKELICKDDLNVENEAQVFQAVLNWMKYCPDDRSTELPELLRAVRMPLLELLYLTQVAENEELLRNSIPCRDLLDEAKNYKLFPQIRKSTCSFTTEPRQFTKITCENQDNENECIYKLHRGINCTVQKFDLNGKKWLTKGNQRTWENTGCSSELNNKMYYFVWARTLRYDPAKNEYEYLNDMPTSLCFAGASALKNKIYVCGGRICFTPSDAVECFDPENNKWTTVRSMRIGRWGARVVTLGEFVFVLGGQDSSAILDCVERYHPETDKWKTMPSMLTKRTLFGAATLNGKIYACGGRVAPLVVRGIETAEVYDPIKNKWEFMKSMNTARCDFVLLPLNGKLYALGGEDENGKPVHNFEIYDPESNEWTSGSSSDTSHYPTSGAVVM